MWVERHTDILCFSFHGSYPYCWEQGYGKHRLLKLLGLVQPLYYVGREA